MSPWLEEFLSTMFSSWVSLLIVLWENYFAWIVGIGLGGLSLFVLHKMFVKDARKSFCKMLKNKEINK